MQEKYLIRQWELLDAKKLGQVINVVGAGAIGSFTALALAKMGFENICVWDDDEVSEENMSCQFYRLSDIGKPKVEALREIIKDFTGVAIDIKNKKYESGQLKGIVIMALDNMKARALVWNNHAEMSIGTKLIIDGRMGSLDALAFAMNPLDPKDCSTYQKTLYSDEAAVQERCTAKSIMFTVLAISSHIAKIVFDFVNEKPYARTMQWSIEKNDQKCWPNKKM